LSGSLNCRACQTAFQALWPQQVYTFRRKHHVGLSFSCLPHPNLTLPPGLSSQHTETSHTYRRERPQLPNHNADNRTAATAVSNLRQVQTLKRGTKRRFNYPPRFRPDPLKSQYPLSFESEGRRWGKKSNVGRPSPLHGNKLSCWSKHLQLFSKQKVYKIPSRRAKDTTLSDCVGYAQACCVWRIENAAVTIYSSLNTTLPISPLALFEPPLWTSTPIEDLMTEGMKRGKWKTSSHIEVKS
jgi:hypothetical protein